MSETLNGAELARVFLPRGTSAEEVASTDLEALTKTVAYRRGWKIVRDATDPALPDEQIARSILEYARSEPADWPAQTPSLGYARTDRRWVALIAVLVVVGAVGTTAISVACIYVWAFVQTLRAFGW